jgi:hypothetical protein
LRAAGSSGSMTELGHLRVVARLGVKRSIIEEPAGMTK